MHRLYFRSTPDMSVVVEQLTAHARESLLLLLATVPFVLVVAKVVIYFVDPSGLRAYPGPFLAKFTDAWIFWVVCRNRWSSTVEDIHKKYGNAPFIASYVTTEINCIRSKVRLSA